MACKTIRFIYVLYFCFLWHVESHVRFVCPRPASVRSDISFTNQSIGYCGLDMNVEFDKEYAEVRPGLFTLHFEETVFHRNSPFRVSLHDTGSDEHCVLLDHIPHNNLAYVSSDCAQNGNKYPLGICTQSDYFITVNIPDIECRHCYLRLVNILVESYSLPCDLNNGTCEGYVSCANIQIRPSVAGQGRNISSCVEYEDNLAGDWPFRPEEYSNVDLEVGHDKVDPLILFDSLHKTLHIDIPRNGFPTEVEEVLILMNSSIAWNMTVTDEHKVADTVIVTWNKMDANSIHHLRAGHYVLNITCRKESFAGNISLQVQKYAEGQYLKAEAVDYSSSGWLADDRFRGAQAKDLTVVTPAGSCAPLVRHFVSFLHPQEVFRFMHGILVASIVDNYADITAAFYGASNNITAITILGSQILGAPDLKLPLSHLKSSILQVSVDISSQIPFIDTVQFLKTVVVETANPSMGLTGSLEEGMSTILRSGRDVKGVGALQLTKGQWMKYEILITGLESEVHGIELTNENGVTYDLSENIWHLSPAFCLVEGLVHDLSSQLLLELWQGRLLLKANTNSTILRGIVTVPGSVYCQAASGPACLSFDITAGGKPVQPGQERVPPSGKAVFLLDGAKVLHYSIEINNLKSQSHLLEAIVKDGGVCVFCIKLQPQKESSTTYSGMGQLQVSADLLKNLSAGNLKLEISPVESVLLGFLPAIKDYLCVFPKKYLVGEHRGYWSEEAAPFQTMFAIVGDSLVFKYDGNVTLFTIPSKKDFLECNFDHANQEGTEVINNTQVIHSVELRSEQTLYFASQDQCNNTPPLRLSVSVTKPVPPAVGDSTDKCGLLVFSDWRQQHLSTYKGPEPTAPALTGLMLGSLIALAFFFWDRRLRQKAEVAIPGSRFQRF